MILFNRHTSTIIAKCILDPALPKDPCCIGSTHQKLDDCLRIGISSAEIGVRHRTYTQRIALSTSMSSSSPDFRYPASGYQIALLQLVSSVKFEAVQFGTSHELTYRPRGRETI
jgi:hypothetical protein